MPDQQSCKVLVTFNFPEMLRDVVTGIVGYVKQYRRNWQVLCVSGDEFLANFESHRCDGAMTLVHRTAHRLLDQLQRSATPVVNLTSNLCPQLPSVLSDDQAVGRMGAMYLKGLGFRTFGFVPLKTPWSRDRLTGFCKGLQEAGLPPPMISRPLEISDFRYTSGIRARRLLAPWLRGLGRRIGIMAPNDLVGRTLLNICQAENLEVPSDIAILGVDNILTLCEVSPIPLSSIAQDFPRIGFEAARLLDKLMTSKGKAAPSPVLISPGRLIARASTQVWAYDDPLIANALQAIHENAAVGIRMSDLLRRIPLSRKWLDHRFKQLVGHTPTEEIRRCRLRHVRELLLETDMSLRQITMRCRFSFPENMIRAFRAAYGMSPQAYRKRHRILRP